MSVIDAEIIKDYFKKQVGRLKNEVITSLTGKMNDSEKRKS